MHHDRLEELSETDRALAVELSDVVEADAERGVRCEVVYSTAIVAATADEADAVAHGELGVPAAALVPGPGSSLRDVVCRFFGACDRRNEEKTQEFAKHARGHRSPNVRRAPGLHGHRFGRRVHELGRRSTTYTRERPRPG